MAFGLGGKKKKAAAAAAAAVGDEGIPPIEVKPKKVRKPSRYRNIYAVYGIMIPMILGVGALLAHVNMNEQGNIFFNGFFGIIAAVLVGGLLGGTIEEIDNLPPIPGQPKKEKKEKPPKVEKEKKKRGKKEKKKKDKKKSGGGWLSFGGKKKAADDEPDTDAEEVASEEAASEESSSDEASDQVDWVAEDSSESPAEKEASAAGDDDGSFDFGELDEIVEAAEAPAAEAESTPAALDDPLAGQPVEDVQVDDFDFDAMVGDDLKTDADWK